MSARRGDETEMTSYEEVEIRTADGASLRARVEDPDGGTPLVGTVVLSHAMFARKSEFGRRDRPGLSAAIRRAGYRTIAFDFRGHGDSELPASASDWRYDDLVRFDMPAVVEAARARGEERPVLVLGHSLGGHVALAAQGTQRLAADGIVAVATNVWVRELEPSRLRWTAKRAVARGALAMAERLGRLPARSLGFGSDDASGAYVADLFRPMSTGRWQSADGADDYLASLANVEVPVCAVVSAGDHVMCHPVVGDAFARRCAGPVEVLHVLHAERGGRAPRHMELVTSDLARTTLLRAVEWVRARARISAGVSAGQSV